MARSSVETGEKVDLTGYYENLSRRQFLRGIASISFGAASVSSLVEKAYGAVPEGETIVHKYDGYNRPATVRVVEPERKRRIQVLKYIRGRDFGHLDIEVNGLTIRQQSDDPTDLALEVCIDPPSGNQVQQSGQGQQGIVERPANAPEAIGAVPNLASTLGQRARVESNIETARAIRDVAAKMPIVYRVGLTGEKKVRSAAKGGGRLHQEGSVDELAGTITSVGYVDGDPALLTVYHLEAPRISGGDDYNIHYEGTELELIEYDQAIQEKNNNTDPNGMDAAAYSTDNISAEPLRTVSAIPDIDPVGTWSHTGIMDEVTLLNSISATMYGQSSGELELSVENAYTSVSDQATFVATSGWTGCSRSIGGDSGGPWIDDEGYLIGSFIGEETSNDSALTRCHMYAGTGKEWLDAIGASLMPPIDGTSPTDPDGDKKYEDLNGNGEIDYQDLVTYNNNMQSSSLERYVDAYDYNNNGDIDYSDLVELFNEIN